MHGGLGQDGAPMRLIANLNIQRLKAVLEETQAMGGVKIPCLGLKCPPGCEYLPFPICYQWHSPAKSCKGGGLRKTRVAEKGRQGF